MTELRVPPHSQDAEKSVLGSMMLGPDCIDEVRMLLTYESFYMQRNGKMFEAILSLHDSRVPVDPMVLCEDLLRRQWLEEIGGAEYVMEIVESVPHAAHAVYYANIVRRNAVTRSLIFGMRALVDRAYKGDEPEEIAAEVSALAESAQQGIVGQTSWTAAQSLDSLEQFERDLEAGRVRVIPFGIAGIDNKIDIGTRDGVKQGGMQGGDLIVLGARPSIGKTALATQIAVDCASNTGPAAIFSLEMKQRRVTRRVVRDMSRAEFRKLPLMINSTLRKHRDILTEIRLLVKRHGVQFVIVDHIGLVHPPNERIDRRLQVAEMSRSFKETAEALNIPIMVLSQLNRTSEKAGRRPGLSDLAESSALDQDADIAILLHRETRSDSDCEVILAKNRDGETGLVKLEFKAAIARLVEKDVYGEFGI